ncbi:hypothetical protein BT63DRAFT_477771 [Microthyrium microscopicum]|uniref:Small ribosomal subunit protein mS41 n=1 Tax=Microthyrium microscopicum TaxID=703497 RepID=A0A6A6UIH1_9PEZI|nr:hypothetical protein BT63DRAFT_477771 [Microthyrium microscopicum]
MTTTISPFQTALQSLRTLSFKSQTTTSWISRRSVSGGKNRLLTRPVPPPTPFVPDVKTFLQLIGRNLSEHESKIPSWDSLFQMSSYDLRQAGIEPPRARKYLCWWRERFRQGVYGIGGDFAHVHNGVGHIQVVQIDAPADKTNRFDEQVPLLLRTPGKFEIPVNVPHDSRLPTVPLGQAKKVDGVTWRPQHRTLKGRYLEPLPQQDGTRATLAWRDGLWEVRRGHKVDGGERRKAEVRATRRIQERKDARAAAAKEAAAQKSAT